MIMSLEAKTKKDSGQAVMTKHEKMRFTFVLISMRVSVVLFTL